MRASTLMRTIASDVGEPRLRWIAALYEAFEATMQARLDDAERYSELAFEIGTQIGEPDAFSLYAGQLFVNRSFAGRYDELLPLVEGAIESSPDVLAFRLAYGITCAAVDRRDETRAILRQGADDGFSRIPRDYLWMTTVIGYAVLAIELQDAETAAQLYPILEPYADEVAFSGVSSQGPINAYLGKLASLMGRHDEADAHLQRALDVTRRFGWQYHCATTLVALALSRRRRAGALDDESRGMARRSRRDRRGTRPPAHRGSGRVGPVLQQVPASRTACQLIAAGLQRLVRRVTEESGQARSFDEVERVVGG